MKDFGIKTFEKLYTSGVVPVLDYNSSVWGYKDFSCINSVQNKALRYFLGVHKFAPVLAINGDIGWLPSKERRWCNMIRLWKKLVTMDEHRICKRVFNWDFHKCKNNWSSEVYAVLNFTGLTDEFDSKIPCVLSDVRKILYEKYSVEWKNDLVNYPKLRTYRLIKFEFECEKYVDINLNRNERSVLAQFICGILPLRIETGRFVGEAEQDRLCKLCQENCVENEIHFLMSCNFYNEI